MRENTHQRLLDQLAEQHARDRAATEQRHKGDLAEAEATHRQSLASYKAKLAADAERRRAEIAADAEVHLINQEGMRQAAAAAKQLAALAKQTETTTAALTAQLETLAGAEATMLTAMSRVVGGRHDAVQTLLGEFDAATTPERYRIVLDTVSEPDTPWLLASAVRHGLNAGDPAIHRLAWLRLMQSALIDTPNGQSLVAEHVHSLEADPILLRFLIRELAPKLAEQPRLAHLLTSGLPSVTQWASRVVSSSSKPSEAQYILKAPQNDSPCDSKSFTTWRPTESDETRSIQVAFVTPVLLPEVAIHEVRGAGFVHQLILGGPDGQATEYAVDDQTIGCGGVARFRLYQHPDPVLELTVLIDATNEDDPYRWRAIDAISLTGIPVMTAKQVD